MNILTFDLEEWFHVLDNPLTKSENEWSNFESRIEIGMQYIYDILDNTGCSATFFVVGWIAEKYPDIIRKLLTKGFEIGSHTHLHQLVFEQNRETFFKDIERSIKTLEDLTGNKVRSFRAPGFSITEKNIWAFEVIHRLGIEIDSSVFPAGRDHGGFSNYNISQPSIIEYNGIQIKEFPINTQNFFGIPIVFSGGGYFRFFNYGMIKYWSKNSNYIMTYFHPRDFDYHQPILPGLNLKRKFKSYVGLKKCKPKLEKWLTDFDFIDLKTANNQINWDKVPVVNL